MAQAYLDKLEAMLAPLAARLAPGTKLEFKHFFSGAAVYARGRICITLTPVGLAMKLPEADRAALKKRGAKPLRYFPKAPIKKDYVVLPRAVRENTRSLRAWARKSIEYAETLPAAKGAQAPKKPGKRSRNSNLC